MASAYQRWKGIQHIQSDTSFMRSGWFTFAMLALLVGSVISLVVVRILRKISERKTAGEGICRRRGSKRAYPRGNRHSY